MSDNKLSINHTHNSCRKYSQIVCTMLKSALNYQQTECIVYRIF